MYYKLSYKLLCALNANNSYLIVTMTNSLKIEKK